MPFLKLLHPYLPKQKQSENKWHIQFVVWNYLPGSEGSVIQPLLFNIFLCDLL